MITLGRGKKKKTYKQNRLKLKFVHTSNISWSEIEYSDLIFDSNRSINTFLFDEGIIGYIDFEKKDLKLLLISQLFNVLFQKYKLNKDMYKFNVSKDTIYVSFLSQEYKKMNEVMLQLNRVLYFCSFFNFELYGINKQVLNYALILRLMRKDTEDLAIKKEGKFYDFKNKEMCRSMFTLIEQSEEYKFVDGEKLSLNSKTLEFKVKGSLKTITEELREHPFQYSNTKGSNILEPTLVFFEKLFEDIKNCSSFVVMGKKVAREFVDLSNLKCLRLDYRKFITHYFYSPCKKKVELKRVKKIKIKVQEEVTQNVLTNSVKKNMYNYLKNMRKNVNKKTKEKEKKENEEREKEGKTQEPESFQIIFLKKCHQKKNF